MFSGISVDATSCLQVSLSIMYAENRDCIPEAHGIYTEYMIAVVPLCLLITTVMLCYMGMSTTSSISGI